MEELVSGKILNLFLLFFLVLLEPVRFRVLVLAVVIQDGVRNKHKVVG
jgi:hypothetical protein